jgi:lipopolysaccharide assembly protein A
MNEFLEAIVPITRIGQDEEAPEKEGLAMHLFLIVALGLAILTVIFALQNPIPVGVTFFIWKFEGSLALVLILTFALGVLVTLLISIPAIVRRRSSTSRQTKKIEELENRSRERTPPPPSP